MHHFVTLGFSEKMCEFSACCWRISYITIYKGEWGKTCPFAYYAASAPPISAAHALSSLQVGAAGGYYYIQGQKLGICILLEKTWSKSKTEILQKYPALDDQLWQAPRTFGALPQLGLSETLRSPIPCSNLTILRGRLASFFKMYKKINRKC